MRRSPGVEGMTVLEKHYGSGTIELGEMVKGSIVPVQIYIQ